MPTDRLRCPACGLRYATEPEDDPHEVVLCPECAHPVPRSWGERRGWRPKPVWALAAMLAGPPAVVVLDRSLQHWFGGGFLRWPGMRDHRLLEAVVVTTAFLAIGVLRGSAVARLVTLAFGAVQLTLGGTGVLLIMVGLVVHAISRDPLLPYLRSFVQSGFAPTAGCLLVSGLVILWLTDRPLVRRWCDRPWVRGGNA